MNKAESIALAQMQARLDVLERERKLQDALLAAQARRIEVDILGEEADRRAKQTGAPRHGFWKLSDWCIKHRLGLTIWGICTLFFGIGSILLVMGLYGYLMNQG